MSPLVERINELIKNRKTTQADVAKAIGVTIPTFGRWVNGKGNIPADCIISISRFLDVSPMYLLTGEDSSLAENISPPGIDPELLQLIRRLNKEEQIELRGYIRGVYGRSVAADPSEAPSGKMAK